MIRHLCHALRQLRRSPGFAAVAVATLALGIGANTAIFSVVHGVLLRELPFADAERLVTVWETDPRRGVDRNVVHPGNFADWRERSRSFSSLAGFMAWSANLSGPGGGPERLAVGYVTGDFFDTLGAKMLLGRALGPEDARQDSADVVVLSAALWRRRFGADPAIVGRSVTVDGEPATVVGVAEERFDLPPGTMFWEPLAVSDEMRRSRGRWMSVVGRLAPGASPQSAQAEMSALAARLADERPEANAGWGANVVPLREHLVGGWRAGLWLLMAAVGCVLAIACVNLANLMLARGAGRRRELAIRAALGAARRRLAGLVLAEAGLIAVLGGALGVAVGQVGLEALLAWVPAEVPGFLPIAVDGRVLGFTAVSTVAAALLAGAAPALAAGRTSLVAALAAGGGARLAGRRGGFSRHLPVAVQTALSLVLLAGAGLLLRSFWLLGAVDPGFATAELLAVQVDLPRGSYAEGASQAAFFSAAEASLRTLPGVDSVGAVSWLPLGGPGAATAFQIAGRPAPDPEQAPVADVRVVTAGFFDTLGLPLRAGRRFAAEDRAGAPKRAIVSESTARQYWPAGDALGSRLTLVWAGGHDAEIVGVVGDARLVRLDAELRPVVYLPAEQSPQNFMTFLVRSASPPASVAAGIRARIAALDPQVAASAVRPMVDVVSASLKRPRFLASLLAAFAALATLLAAVGIYGVVARSVAERRREIGVRMALGGRRVEIFRWVMGRSLRPVLLGAALGLPAALVLGRLVRGLLFGVTPSDPPSLAAALVGLVAVAGLACALPARAALRVEPLEALRPE